MVNCVVGAVCVGKNIKYMIMSKKMEHFMFVCLLTMNFY